MTTDSLALLPICMGVCGRPWDESPFCSDCLADIKRWSETGEVECFAPVPGRGGYMVSSFGQVKSLDRVVICSDGRRLRYKGQTLKTSPNPQGYPATNMRGTMQIHTIMALAFFGPRPAGQEVCHLGDIKHDNRLFRLRYDTCSANKRDMVANGKHGGAAKTHCIHGHEYTPENTYLDKDGHRQCRECHRNRWDRDRVANNARSRARYHKNRDAINERRRKKRGKSMPTGRNPLGATRSWRRPGLYGYCSQRSRPTRTVPSTPPPASSAKPTAPPTA